MKKGTLYALLALNLLPLSAAEQDLGDWMAIGDSITHGTHEYSYRWHFQKILIDNGIAYDAVGCRKTCFYAGHDSAEYNGGVFDNEHCAQFNVQARELAGVGTFERHYHTDNAGRPTSMKRSNIHNWLGLSTELTPDAQGRRGSYAGEVFAPHTFTLMLGTNDLNMKRAPQDLLADVETLLQAALSKQPQANIYLMSVPYCKDKLPAARIDAYNTLLQAKAEQYRATGAQVHYICINHGLQDTTGKTVGGAHPSMMMDWAHPTAQGNLLIAGNLAKGMGLPGRTAGLPRKAAADFAQHDTREMRPLSHERGYTAEIELPAAGHSLSLCDSAGQCELQLTTEGILANGAMLYATDCGTTAGRLRVVYHPGDATRKIPAGYYVWLGAQLIGEAIAPAPRSTRSGIHLQTADKKPALRAIYRDATAPWAPPL